MQQEIYRTDKNTNWSRRNVMYTIYMQKWHLVCHDISTRILLTNQDHNHLHGLPDVNG
jgi:hypothetical protein